MMRRPNNPWIEMRSSRDRPTLRLFCFPCAGGSAQQYRSLARNAPPSVEVCPIQLPGRLSRINDEPFRRCDPLARALLEAIAPELDVPFAFFGHSLGTILAFEVVRELRRRGLRPQHLVVAARIPPQAPLTRPPLHTLSQAEFLRVFQSRFQPLPPEILREPELLALIVGTMQADFEVHETYAYRPEPPLDVPITAMGGLGDDLVSKEDLAMWCKQTTAPFALHMLPGGHSFLLEDEQTFSRLLWTTLGV